MNIHIKYLKVRRRCGNAAAAVAFGVLLFLIWTVLKPVSAAAAGDGTGLDESSQVCINCHSSAGMSTTLSSGETLQLGVDVDFFRLSIHGQNGIGCTQCHFDHSTFPHPALPDWNRREYTINRNEACGFCHNNIAEDLKGNVHAVALEEGRLEAAVCTDCHGAHDTKSLVELGPNIASTCRECHSEIYDLYANSVHGEALLGEGNNDVPNCIDCHGAHKIEGVNNAPFHLFSPDICGRCHANRELMGKYGINTNVMDTWVTDFHGKTVFLDQATAPYTETDKPVCIDCHGVHDIKAPSDPESTVMKENLLRTCKKCHPAASSNFPDSWMAHYRPSLNKYPIVFFVTWFYRLLIPGVIGGMLVFVITDYIRHKIDKKKGGTHAG